MDVIELNLENEYVKFYIEQHCDPFCNIFCHDGFNEFHRHSICNVCSLIKELTKLDGFGEGFSRYVQVFAGELDYIESHLNVLNKQ